MQQPFVNPAIPAIPKTFGPEFLGDRFDPRWTVQHRPDQLTLSDVAAFDVRDAPVAACGAPVRIARAIATDRNGIPRPHFLGAHGRPDFPVQHGRIDPRDLARPSDIKLAREGIGCRTDCRQQSIQRPSLPMQLGKRAGATQ
jgi:hypothetical protein